jgi:predicted amidohydrolase
MESRSTAPGAEVVAADSPAGRLGLTTCYDLRFPQLYQTLAFALGAQARGGTVAALGASARRCLASAGKVP